MGKNITDRQLFVGGDRAMEELRSLVGGQSSIELSVGSLPLPFGFVFSVGLWVDVGSLLHRKSLQLRVDLWGRTTADTTEV